MGDNIKSALLVIVMVAIGAATVMLGVKPNLEAKTALDAEISALQTTLADLQAKEADRAIYEAGIVRNQQTFNDLVAEFPEDIQQENYIKFLGDMEDKKDIDIIMNSNQYNEPEEFYILGTGAVGTGTDAAAATTAAATTTAAGATTEATAQTTTDATGQTTDTMAMDSEMKGIKASIGIEYTGTYKGIKSMVTYIQTYEDRMTIDTIDLTYSEEDEKLSGSFNFNVYAITAENRSLAEPDIEGVDIGVDNPFNAADKSNNDVSKDISKDMEDGDEILSDYDYYVALNPSTSNADAVTIGAKGDASAKISTNENEVVNATVKFFMVGTKYYVSYNIGDVSYPENFEQGVEFDPGEKLNLAIQSSKRKNNKDKSGVKLVIDNETDMPLNVKIDGDDTSDPRVKIASRIGKVQIYE